MDDVALVPPDELELVPPEPPLTVLLAEEEDAPPDELELVPPEPPELAELAELLPPLPALLELEADFPPEALLDEPPLALLPPLLELDALEDPALPLVLRLALATSLLQATEPKPAKARKLDTNSAPYLELMLASLHLGERDLW